MRIRKRTPARAASPPGLCCPSPTPLLPKELPREQEEEEDDAEEKRVILVAAPEGRQDSSQVPVPASPTKNSAAPDGELKKPEKTELRDDSAADKARCSRNDGKRWRCKNAAVPGFLFCDRHVAWSVRQRQPRAKKKKKSTSTAVFQPAVPTKQQEDEEGQDTDNGSTAGAPGLVHHADGDGFYYYGGFQPGGRKRARSGGGVPGPGA